MAKTNAADRINATYNPFSGMTMAQMKKKWSSMTPKQREANVSNFRKAAKSAPKAKSQPNRIPKDEDKRSRNPEAVALRAKRDRIMKQYPATGPYKIAADSKKAKAALDANKKPQDKPKTETVPVKNRRGRTTGTKEVPVTPKKKTSKARYNRRGRRI